MATKIKPYITTHIKYLSPEWEKARREMGIGGSEASAIAGFNPYASAFSVYWDKLGKSEPKEVSEAMRQGSELEEYVAQRFTEATGKKVKRNSFMLQSKEYPFMLADVDRFIVGENAILECKTTLNRDDFSYENAQNIPAYHLVQVLHYMAVTGAEKAYIATLVFGRAFYIVEVNRADYESDIAGLIAIEKRFWEQNVQSKIPPKPDGSAISTQVLSEQFPTANDELPTVDLMPYAVNLNRLSEIKKEIDKLTSEKAELENIIKNALGEASLGEYGSFKVTWKNRDSVRLDSKALKTEMPDIYAKYSRVTSTRTFLFNEKK